MGSKPRGDPPLERSPRQDQLAPDAIVQRQVGSAQDALDAIAWTFVGVREHKGTHDHVARAIVGLGASSDRELEKPLVTRGPG